MTTFKNKNFTKRNYECTNIVCCESATSVPPNDNYIECDSSEIEGLTHLHTENSVRYYGYM